MFFQILFWEIQQNITIVISTLSMPIHSPDTRFNRKRRLSLIDINLTSTVDNKELFTLSVFQPWIAKVSASDSYLASQPQGHFHELKLCCSNLSILCKIIIHTQNPLQLSKGKGGFGECTCSGTFLYLGGILGCTI